VQTEDGSTVAGWYATTASQVYYDGSNGWISFDADGNGTSKEISNDLTSSWGYSPHPTKWVLRATMTITNNGGTDQNLGNYWFFGLSSSDADTGIDGSQDAMGGYIVINRNGTADGLRAIAANDSDVIDNGGGQVISSGFEEGTYFVEIIRNGDSCTVNLRSGSHSGALLGSVSDISPGVSGLKYLTLKPTNESVGQDDMDGYYNDITFYDGVTCVAASGALTSTVTIPVTEDKAFSGHNGAGCLDPGDDGNVEDSSAELFLVTAYPQATYNKCYRAYTEFDISSIPADAIVTGATLSLYVSGSPTLGSTDVDDTVEIRSMPFPGTSTDDFRTLYEGAALGNLIATTNELESSGARTIDLSATGAAEIAELRASGQNWLSLGWKLNTVAESNLNATNRYVDADPSEQGTMIDGYVTPSLTVTYTQNCSLP